jgi:hypothetical protein
MKYLLISILFPYLLLGGELGNSSASSPEDIARIFPKLQRMGLNTVLVPAYWELTEPVEGQYNFTLTDQVLAQARQHQLKVVFLWFGAWKNSMSCYAPAWVKADTKRFPRAMTRTGKPLEILSAFSEEVAAADERAFTAWLQHLKEADSEAHTVIMLQIENEIGMLEEARDYSPAAEKAYRQEMKGQEATLENDERFMARHYARYVERLARVARQTLDVPLYVNAALNSRGRKPGEYPSAGPLAHLMDIWKEEAPHVDILAPDIYDKGFADWIAQYHRPNNRLFIPEIRLCDDDGVRAFYAFAEHDALGFSPFSIEDASDDPAAPLVEAYHCLAQLTPLILPAQGTGRLRGVLLDAESKQTVLQTKDAVLDVKHYFTLPWDARATDGSVWPEGGGLILRLQKDEYLIAGKGLVVEFNHPEEYRLKQQTATAEQQRGEDGFLLQGTADATAAQAETPARWKARRLGLASVDEVDVRDDGTLQTLRRLNGDQTHQGRHVRIGVDHFQILHVKLYEY